MFSIINNKIIKQYEESRNKILSGKKCDHRKKNIIDQQKYRFIEGLCSNPNFNLDWLNQITSIEFKEEYYGFFGDVIHFYAISENKYLTFDCIKKTIS